MSDFVDSKSLEVATRLAEEHRITDPRIIALIQLGAAGGIKAAFHPYHPFDQQIESQPQVDNQTLLQALNTARGWVATCSSSVLAQRNLTMIDTLLERTKP